MKNNVLAMLILHIVKKSAIFGRTISIRQLFKVVLTFSLSINSRVSDFKTFANY